MVFPGEAPRTVEVMTAAPAASAAASPSSHHTPEPHRSTQLRVKPRSRLPQPPFRSWDNNRLLRCVGADAAGGGLPPTPGAASTSSPSPSCPGRRSTGPRDDGFERIRAKLMDHLREAAGRIELPLEDARRKELATDAPLSDGFDADEEEEGGNNSTDRVLAAPAATTASAPSTTAGEELPWTLRTRRTSAASNSPRNREHASASRLAAPRHRAGASERREAAARRRRPRFSVPLTKEEIDEDLYAFTGRRAPRRPKKHPRAVQKQLDMVFPGMWLSEVTAETYQVAEPPPPPPPS
ncbi:hypothetical protein Taro_047846 [Colocasia esculenta]|uniref:DUF1639 family protein n=1 Tax=Colocasia esculenta TaxID=4460 RepID=A0A843X5V9_COLES|nr:hypothetical protein [Colocasia esculenta]